MEYLRPGVSAERAQVVLFDFDGTLSLIRSGWADVMMPMMVETLAELNSGESEEELRAAVAEFVSRLTGKQTIYQMIELAENVRRRGGEPLDPLVHKKMYLDRLWQRIQGRVADLRSGRLPPDQYLVPGSRQLLESLQSHSLKMYLASGTDEQDVKEEARLLDIARYFNGNVYGALDDYKRFSKAMLIRGIIESAECSGEQFLAFGDGYVEIEDIKRVGGVAVGVATAGPDCLVVDEWKRCRLAGVGADWIVANYLDHEELMGALFSASVAL
ncbi:MAG: HAD hydrolase-like protein [Bryobacteraceae bacterium]|nr:HAD hydrolase-like protein [Bryobacteraceae bacterium]